MSKRQSWYEHETKCYEHANPYRHIPSERDHFEYGWDAAKKDNITCYCGDTKLKLEDHHCEGCKCEETGK